MTDVIWISIEVGAARRAQSAAVLSAQDVRIVRREHETKESWPKLDGRRSSRNGHFEGFLQFDR